MEYKAILKTYNSELDNNGMHQCLATITNIKNGETMTFKTENKFKASEIVFKSAIDCFSIQITEKNDIPINEFNQAKNRVNTSSNSDLGYVQLINEFIN